MSSYNTTVHSINRKFQLRSANKVSNFLNHPHEVNKKVYINIGDSKCYIIYMDKDWLQSVPLGGRYSLLKALMKRIFWCWYEILLRTESLGPWNLTFIFICKVNFSKLIYEFAPFNWVIWSTCNSFIFIYK